MRSIWMICLVGIGISGCGEDPPGDTAPPDNETDTTTLTEPKDCSNYEFNGVTYDCSTLDRCEEDDITFRLACCDCDTALCNPDPTCPPPEEYTPPEPPDPDVGAESCMECHNGSNADDYYGTGISNPHPFAGAAYIKCTTCHGGDGQGSGKEGSHVPVPPDIGDDLFQQNNPEAYFNRLTLIGIDKFYDYEVNGVTYSGLDYLQFVNPGDMRVVTDGRSCGMGGCHSGEHAEWVPRGVIATEAGFYSGSMFGAGVTNAVPEHQGLYQDTAADYGFRYVEDPNWVYDPLVVGPVGKLLEFPDYGVYGDTTGVYENPIYDANQFANYIYDPNVDPQNSNRIKANTPLDHVFKEAITFGCGDCHAGSAGQNNRYADFRSSGCTSCHMEYSYDGKSRSTDPNVNKLEPANPDAIAAPERAHIMDHQIRNVAKILPTGAFIRGISDKVCVGCHQGSNRTVLQFWGIRLDQNQDVTNNLQYPANPVTFVDAANDTRLYDPAVNNVTFNGRIAAQHLVFEDYDGDARDDTPADVHYEAGMGCIDCHGSRDVHNGTDGDPTSGQIQSRMDHSVKIQCESCHGSVEYYADTTTCEDYTGNTVTCAVDRNGNPLRNVTLDVNGNYWLTSRVDGQLHFLPQTKDTVVNNGKSNPVTGQLVYNALASYAMGRADGNALTGTGPIQTDPNLYDNGFSHSDDMECIACHASWTNSCVGCHLETTYDANPANYFFSNNTGERIVTPLTVADFVYQTPVLFTLGVNSRDKISSVPPGMKVFFRYTDLNGNESQVFAFSDRNGNGNNPFTGGRGAFGNLNHEMMMPHSVRGKVSNTDEGPRYCVSCHLTVDAIDNFGAEYDVFRTALDNRDYAQLDFNLLQEHIGQNTGNQLNSPFFVHMAAGLGTGLFLFDEFGCPVNPLDANANRQYCQNGAPADNFDLNNVVYDLDKVVETDGTTNASNSHPLQDSPFSVLRAGALDPGMSGPMGAQLLQKLTDPNFGIVLDSWLDADGQAQGDAANHIQ